MTWLRLDCDSPDHPIIGLLAQEVSADTDRAFSCYVRTLLGFGDHRVDGRPAFVPDVTLEAWARWRGKGGKWAAAFRSLCIESREGQKDAPGVIKGWWRQRALLEKQIRDAQRPKPPKNPPDSPDNPPRNQRGFPAGIEVDVDGNGYEQRTTPTTVGPRDREGEPPVPAGTPEASLINRMASTPDRWAVWDFLDRFTDAEQLPWVRRLAAYLEGLDFPVGICPTPQQLATACRDYSGNYSPAHFRGFVLRAIQGPRPMDGKAGPRRSAAATGEAQLEAGRRWAASRGGSGA